MLRIQNATGLGHDTKIISTDTGDDLIKLLAIRHGAIVEIGKTVEFRAAIDMVQIDVAPDRVVFETKNPATGNYQPVAAIEFRDGSRVEIADDGTPSVGRVA